MSHRLFWGLTVALSRHRRVFKCLGHIKITCRTHENSLGMPCWSAHFVLQNSGPVGAPYRPWPKVKLSHFPSILGLWKTLGSRVAPYVFLTTAAGLLAPMAPRTGSHGPHTGHLRAPYSPHDWSYGCFQACTSSAQTVWYTYVHLTEPVGYLRPCGQNTTTPTDRPYASDHSITDGCFRIDFPRATGPYGFPSLTNNRSFYAYSSMCRRPLHELYHNLYINEANIPTNIKIKEKKNTESLTNMTSSRGEYWPSGSVHFNSTLYSCCSRPFSFLFFSFYNIRAL